jgi:predicted PurR-regulated permease PerM
MNNTPEGPTAAPAAVLLPALRGRTAAGVVTATVLSLGALWMAASFVVPVLMAVLLAVLLWPAVQQVQRWLRLRVLAALVVMAAACALSVAVLAIVLSQLAASVERVPDVLRLAARDVAALAAGSGGGHGGTWERTRTALEELDRSVARATGTQRGLAPAGAAQRNPSIVHVMLEWMSATAIGAGKALGRGLLQGGVIALLSFFLLCTGDHLAHRLSVWCDGRPLARGRFSPLVCDTAREMRLFGAVTLVTNAAIAVAVAAGFAAFGVENPMLWGLVAGALHFVPYAGLALLLVLTAVEVYAAQASLVAALVAVAYVAGIGVLLGTALATWLQGRASRVDSALMFGGTVFCSVLWGAWGLVLGPLLVVALHVVWRHAQRRERVAEAAPPEAAPEALPAAPAEQA